MKYLSATTVLPVLSCQRKSVPTCLKLLVFGIKSEAPKRRRDNIIPKSAVQLYCTAQSRVTACWRASVQPCRKPPPARMPILRSFFWGIPLSANQSAYKTFCSLFSVAQRLVMCFMTCFCATVSFVVVVVVSSSFSFV